MKYIVLTRYGSQHLGGGGGGAKGGGKKKNLNKNSNPKTIVCGLGLKFCK